MAVPDKQRELELWKTWKSSGSTDAYNALVQRLEPLVQKRVGLLKAAPGVPVEVLEARAHRELRKALTNYDPTRSQMNTHVVNSLRKVNRAVYRHQNFATIPESRILKITEHDAAVEKLKTQGKSATPSAVGRAARMSTADVRRLQRERRADLSTSRFEFDPSGIKQTEYQQALQLVRTSLDPKERVVFDYIIGAKGTPVRSTTALAKVLGVSPSYISKLKGRIAERIETAAGAGGGRG